MTVPQLFLVVAVVVPLVLVGLERLRIDLAALLIVAMLGLAQYLGMGILGAPHSPRDAVKAVSGLGQPVVLTLMGLFVITASLDKSGVTRRVARGLLGIGSRSQRKLIALCAATTALLSLVMNNLAAGALVLPGAMDIARRTGIKPSKLLIPIAYGSLLGGAATYFTTANIIVSDLLLTAQPSQTPLHILAFVPTGGLVAVTGVLFLALFGVRWLPDRDPAPEQMMVRFTSHDLEKFYHLGERLWEVRVPPESPLAGKTLSESEIGGRFGLTVAGMRTGEQIVVDLTADRMIRSGDILLVVGREDRLRELAKSGLQVGLQNAPLQISKYGASLIEVMPAPHSQALGKTLRELEFRTRYRLTALALFRGGRSFRTDVGNFPLMLGDSLIMIGSPGRLKRLRANPDFIVLEPDPVDQTLRKVPAFLSVATLAAAIGASILGWPVFLAMLVGAVFLLSVGVLDMEDAYRSINWQAVFLIAGMYSVSLAMVNTGLARFIGEWFLALVSPLGPLGLAAGAYVLTALLTQVMGGQVSALVAGPITISAAIAMHVNPQAVAVATAIGCSASFFTPIAHPVNILMVSPANYRFRDFFGIGWRLTLVCFMALIAGLILFWGL